MALTPWPADPNSEAAILAAAELRAVLGDNNIDVVILRRIGASASAMVERFAPGAPQAVRDEAFVRVAGWLLDAPSSGLRATREGDVETSFTPSMQSALRASGAMAILTAWKVRRAGVIA